jgi:hypothetical protein
MVAAEEAQPFLAVPVPVRMALIRAPQQHHGDGVVHGPAHILGGRHVETGLDVLQRACDTADVSPLRGIGVVIALPSQVAQVQLMSGALLRPSKHR